MCSELVWKQDVAVSELAQVSLFLFHDILVPDRTRVVQQTPGCNQSAASFPNRKLRSYDGTSGCEPTGKRQRKQTHSELMSDSFKYHFVKTSLKL